MATWNTIKLTAITEVAMAEWRMEGVVTKVNLEQDTFEELTDEGGEFYSAD